MSFLGEFWRAIILYSFMSQHRKNSVKGKVIDKKWFIRIGCLWGLQAGRREMPHPRNLLGYSFIIKGKVGRGRRTSLPFLSRCHASITSSSSRLSRGVFLSLVVKLGPQVTVFHVCREHVLGTVNLVSSLGRYGSHAAIVLLFTARLLLPLHGFVTKPAWFCG